MSIDPEEMKQRRLLREQQRQKKKRSLIVRLVAAAVVLLLCAAVILIVTRPNDPSGVDNTTLSTQQTGDTAQMEETTGPATTVIRLTAAGDLNVTDSVIASGGTDYQYDGTFLDISHLLAQADLSVVNFEGSLGGAPYGTESGSAPQSLMQTLSDSGVDMVQLANSYAIHKGMSGLQTTIAGVKNAGMEPLGVYADNAQAKTGKGYTIRQIQGVKIAFVAFTKGMNGLALPAGSENCVNVLYTDYASTYQTVNTEGITAVLDAVKKESPDITVALLHWGSEYNDTISTSQQKICTLLQDNGVDAIIGTHPHYVQQIQFDPEAGTLVAYSLGDLIGDAQRSGTEYSILLNLEITKDNATGEAKITGFNYTPIFTVAEEGKPLRVMRIQEAMAAYEAGHIDGVTPEIYAAMTYALQRIASRIAGE